MFIYSIDKLGFIILLHPSLLLCVETIRVYPHNTADLWPWGLNVKFYGCRVGPGLSIGTYICNIIVRFYVK